MNLFLILSTNSDQNKMIKRYCMSLCNYSISFRCLLYTSKTRSKESFQIEGSHVKAED
jgi:hypothetical protein